MRQAINSLEDFTVTIEFDAWTSTTGQSILAVVLTRLGGESWLLDLVYIFGEAHTADFFSSTAIATMHSADIDLKKINSIISDEASNCKLARRLITQELEFSHVIEYRCMAHVFNLVGGSITKHPSVKNYLDQVIKLIGIITRQKLLAKAIFDEGGGRVVRPVPTRWYSTCAAINSVMRIKPVLGSLTDRPECSPELWLPILRDERLWLALNNLKTYFDGLSKIIVASECYDSSLGKSFRSFLDFGYSLFHDLPQSKPFLNVAKSAFVYHFFRTDIDLLLAAYIVDPNNRVRWLTDAAITRGMKMLARIIVESSDQFDRSSGESDGNSARGDDDDDGPFLEIFESEFMRYLSKATRRTEVIEDPLNFWKRNREFLVLKQAGVRLSCCQSSSANTERFFSALGRICSPTRNRLSVHSMANMLAILVREPPSRPSRKKRNQKLVAATQELSEEDSGSGEPGGLLSELSIGDSDNLPETDLEDDSRMFENTSEYERFKAIIDFDQEQPGPSGGQARRSRLSVAERAERIAERISFRRGEL